MQYKCAHQGKTSRDKKRLQFFQHKRDVEADDPMQAAKFYADVLHLLPGILVSVISPRGDVYIYETRSCPSVQIATI